MPDDELSRALESLDGMEIRVPIEADSDGYLDRECPSTTCLFQFKVDEHDWEALFADEAVYCPLCGHSAPAESWFPSEQVRLAQERGVSYAEGVIGEALDRWTQAFNREHSDFGFFSMHVDYRGPRVPREILPVPASEPLDLKIQCERCTARFAVLGSAFFCPCCGHSSVLRVFDDALRKIRVKLGSTDAIREHFARMGQRDEGELLVRSLVESALSDCVVALQRFSEQTYLQVPGTSPPRPNAFQRLDDADELWRGAVGKGYGDWLEPTDLADMRLLYQRRHLLAHTEGIIDQRYLDLTGDQTYRAGQRIVVKVDDVTRLLGYTEIVAAAVRAAVGHG